MDRYKGKIKDLRKLILTDPHYDGDVWCCYHKSFDNANNWNVDIVIDDVNYTENYKGSDLNIKGISFQVLLKNENYKLLSELIELKGLDNVSLFPFISISNVLNVKPFLSDNNKSISLTVIKSSWNTIFLSASYIVTSAVNVFSK